MPSSRPLPGPDGPQSSNGGALVGGFSKAGDSGRASRSVCPWPKRLRAGLHGQCTSVATSPQAALESRRGELASQDQALESMPGALEASAFRCTVCSSRNCVFFYQHRFISAPGDHPQSPPRHPHAYSSSAGGLLRHRNCLKTSGGIPLSVHLRSSTPHSGRAAGLSTVCYRRLPQRYSRRLGNHRGPFRRSDTGKRPVFCARRGVPAGLAVQPQPRSTRW